MQAVDRLTAQEKLVNWIECDNLGLLGHGVEFFITDSRHQRVIVVAFLEGFGWLHQPGSEATVMIRRNPPSFLDPDNWAKILKSTREAVLIFLSDPRKHGWSFRHGPIRILANA